MVFRVMTQASVVSNKNLKLSSHTQSLPKMPLRTLNRLKASSRPDMGRYRNRNMTMSAGSAIRVSGRFFLNVLKNPALPRAPPACLASRFIASPPYGFVFIINAPSGANNETNFKWGALFLDGAAAAAGRGFGKSFL